MVFDLATFEPLHQCAVGDTGAVGDVKRRRLGSFSSCLGFVSVSLLLILASFSAHATQIPDEFKKTGITEKLGQMVPGNVKLVDETGKTVEMTHYFGLGRPVVLALVYYRCPNLCTFVLNGMLDTLKKVTMVPGKEFELVTLSIDPREKPELAAEKKSAYLMSYGKPDAAQGWHFLTGQESEIRRIADAVGFGYQYDAQSNQYGHSAAIFVLTPEGKISRYLYGIEYKPRDFKFSVLDASQGRVGTIVDRLVMYCFRYDPHSRGYSLVVSNVMKLGSLLMILGFGSYLLLFWRKQRGLQGN